MRAYRWTGGVLSGWIEFGDGPNRKRVPIEMNEIMAKTSKIPPSGFSGMMVIGRRPAAKAEADEECWVWLRVEHEVTISGSVGQAWKTRAEHGSWKPRGDTEGVLGLGEKVTFHSGPRDVPFSGNPEYTWMELRVRTE